MRGAGHFATIDRLNGAAAALRLLYIDGRQDVDPENFFQYCSCRAQAQVLGRSLARRALSFAELRFGLSGLGGELWGT